MELTDTVRSVLSKKGSDAWSVDADATVFDALTIMAEKRVGALLVTSQGKLTGVISERDYARKIALHSKLSRQTRVREIMSSPTVCVGLDDTVESCMRIMTDGHFRHLAVVEDETIAGVLSIGDLVKWVISAQQKTIEHLHNYINGKYPA